MLSGNEIEPNELFPGLGTTSSEDLDEKTAVASKEDEDGPAELVAARVLEENVLAMSAVRRLS